MRTHNPKYFGVINYTGNKTKLHPALEKQFPTDYTRFVDACAGGLSVAMSVDSNVLANDYCPKLMGVYDRLMELGRTESFKEINAIINGFGLDKENSEGYLELRECYNEDKDPISLLVLLYHSFSNQIRFNPAGEFNTPFGRRTFNPQLQKKLNIFFDIQESDKPIEFSNKSFLDLELLDGDFVYIDPPYKITDATYNVYWSDQLDVEMMEWLEELDSRGIKWAMSNVLQHKGKTNDKLIEWSAKFNTSFIDGVKYVSGAYHAKNMDKPTVEVLITNY